MALSADLARKTRPRKLGSYKVGNAVQVYAGSLIGIDTRDGYAYLWADVAQYRFRGIALNKVLGNTGAVTIPEVEVNETGERLIGINVAGVTSIASVSALVYATDDNTFTLTPGQEAKAIGHVTRWYTGAICDVALFTPEEFYGLL